ncbi:MAG: hypothetical protein ACYDDS_02355 [Candidatus Sulfotelmatobacter sp.]
MCFTNTVPVVYGVESGAKAPTSWWSLGHEWKPRRLGSGVIVILAIFVAAMFSSAAPRSVAQERPQLKRPQQNPDEKPPEVKKKKVKGPRAVGILQLSNGKATLIPVAILVEGKFYDASVYKADPVPMALEGGTVYEAEQAGESQGLFTTAGALHSQNQGSTNPWMGTGSYLQNGTEAAKTTRKAEDVPVGLDNSGDEPPRLTRKSAAASGSSPAPTAASSSDGPSTGKASGSGPANGPGADKAGDQSEKKKSGPPEQKGTEQKGPEQGAAGQGSAGQASHGQESENYYRPTLRRGKPTQAAPEEEAPAAKASPGGSSATSAASGGARVVQVMAAVSDSGGPDPESYKYFWKEGEEDERRKQMLTLAGDELRIYLNARAKGAIAAKAPANKGEAPTRKAKVKPALPVFENVQFRGFDVWRNNQPVMILSADAHFAAEPGAATAPETYSITLASRTDIYGSLRKLYSGVTDKFHLDVTPRLELIDAVDADGDGRGELLFRETTDAGNGYVIYRATGDKLWKMFDSLRAE